MMNAAAVLRRRARAWRLPIAAYQSALTYAKERIQSRDAAAAQPAAGRDHPSSRRAAHVWMSMKAQIEAMRALAYVTAGSLDLAHKLAPTKRHPAAPQSVRGVHDSDRQGLVHGNGKPNSVRRPCKSSAAWATSKRTGIAQQYRDVKIASIYEGTTGIQAARPRRAQITSRHGRDGRRRSLQKSRRSRKRSTVTMPTSRRLEPSWSGASARSAPRRRGSVRTPRATCVRSSRVPCRI